ncbi:hypothetical protein ACFWWU_36590 [Streptomyces sp. NPDC058650]|uniref:hypothetical protein n=1 Tax=Streptomyces sp. NPDC058650 TaxID=3346575 RepID=UPI003663EA11
MEPCPWSGAQLKKLGRHIRDGSDAPPTLPAYSDVMMWYNDVAAEVQNAITNIEWWPLLEERSFEVTSRPKTIDTLRQKLARDHSTPLPSIQDIAGVRFEAEMCLDEQDAVAVAIAGLFGHDEGAIKDLRNDAHSGYRAVHVWLRLPARVEVQIRTHLQGTWANMYESAADHYGRDIRYEWLPEDAEERRMVVALREMSTSRIAQMESDRNESKQLHMMADENGIAGDSSPRAVAIMSRLGRLRARELSNERRMQSDLEELRRFFEMARQDGRS